MAARGSAGGGAPAPGCDCVGGRRRGPVRMPGTGVGGGRAGHPIEGSAGGQGGFALVHAVAIDPVSGRLSGGADTGSAGMAIGV